MEAEPINGKDDKEEEDMLEDLSAFETKAALNTLPAAEMAAIEAIPTAWTASSKTDTCVKHVKLLRQRDPLAKVRPACLRQGFVPSGADACAAGAQVVLFSAFSEALTVVQQAFTRNGVGYVRLENSGRKEVVSTAAQLLRQH